MKPSKQEPVMIQKHPIFKKVKNNHPCNNNLQPVFIDKVDSNHKCLPEALALHKVQPKGEKSANENSKKKVTEETEKQPDCKLPDPKEVPNQSSTAFDIYKEEYTLEELLGLNITEIPCVLEKLIPSESLVILAGHSDVGKSTWYTQLALAIVKGEKTFLGFKLNLLHKRVLIISTEDGPLPLSFRINRQLAGRSIEKNVSNNLKVFFNHDNLEKRIIAYLEKNPVDLIIIDAFGDVFSGDINASNGVRQFLDNYKKICQRFKCSVLFVHHIVKGNKKQISEKDQLLGSTGIVGKVRNVLYLSVKGQIRHLKVVKGNYLKNEDKDKITCLEFDNETLTFSQIFDYHDYEEVDDDEEGLTLSSGFHSRVKNRPGRQKDMKLYKEAVDLFSKGISQVDIAKKVGRDKSTICKWLKYSREHPAYDFSKVEEDDIIDC